MLTLILGKDWKANRAEILKRISRDVADRRPGRILMVPELISHDTERRLCFSAGDTASRYAEVLTFTRLARRVAERFGSASKECLDNGGRVVAMAAAARQLHSRLKAYAAVETKPEFLTELVDAVDEFKRCCITSQDLMEASRRLDGSLAQKLEELALLLDAYDGLCENGKRDPRDQETQLLEQLADCDFAQNHVFYIDGFPDFTRQHFAILEHLVLESKDITISLNCDRPDSTAMAFEKAGATASELIRCAKRAGVPVTIEMIDSEDAPLNAVFQNLYQGRLEIRTNLFDKLNVYQAKSVHEECALAASRVLELVRSGARYRDISVVCSDMSGYGHTLNLVFHRCGIPIYHSGTEDILSKSVIATVLNAMDAAFGGFEQRDVLRYLKSALSPLDLDLCDRVENYAVIWGIRGKKWCQSWENHPDGLGEVWDDAARARLAELEQARVTAIEPLMRLRRGFQEASDVAGQVSALYDFLEELQLAHRLEQLSREMDAAGDNRSAQILNQLWEILLSALEQLHDVLGRSKWDTEAFTRLFMLLLSQYEVGTIPPVLDAVVAGPVSAMRCQEEKHLIVLGACEGSLPGYGGSSGVLTDQERVALRSLGVPLTGGSMEGLQAEFAEIYGVFCGATESITVSCLSGQPSFVFRRLAQMAPKANQSTGDVLVLGSTLDVGAYLARWGAETEAKELGIINEFSDVCRRRSYSLGSVQQENIRGLYGKKMNLSASQVDRHADCRLSYFLKYGLRAKERKEATIDPAEYGTYVHAVLEQTARKVMELGGFHRVSLEKTIELAMEYSDAYAQERFKDLDSQRLQYLFSRNAQELEMVVRELWQELKTAAFEPTDFETAFGGKGRMDAIAIPNRSMDASLRGFVDRVDTWKEMGINYFRVVDYKTGRKDFDYCDVFNGLGLQMLLYLFALEQSGDEILGDNPVSAGVQYFPARAPLVAADGLLSEEEAEAARQKEWKRKGLLLADERVLRAMEPEDAPKRLSCRRSKDGALIGDLANRQQLNLLREYIFTVLGRMVDEIASGKVEPNPYTRGTSHNACAFCPYGAVCHKTQVDGRRNYKAMSAQRFWEEIEKEMNRSLWLKN